MSVIINVTVTDGPTIEVETGASPVFSFTGTEIAGPQGASGTGGGSAVWGGITGTLASQADLAAALAAKELLTNKDIDPTFAANSDTKYPSQKAVNTAIATAVAGGVKYKGTWNATTNIPALSDGTSTTGWQYKVATAGTHDFGSGAITFAIGDYVIYNGATWEKIDTTDQVTSVFSRQGAVVATAGDYNASQVTNTPAGTIAATNVQAAINELDGSIVPIGGIIFWSGNIAALSSYPSWAFCDGTNGTPDLRDKFIVGARQDVASVAKTNIEGSLKVTGGVTGHSHSNHANLTHVGGSVADHTGLTHSIAIANHPDLTHAALSHAASTFTHVDHSAPSQSHTHGAVTLTHADHSVPSFTGSQPSGSFTQPSGSFTQPSGAVGNVGSLTLSLSSTGTARTIATYGGAPSFASGTGSVASSTGSVASATHTHAAVTLSHADHSVASFSGTTPATTFTHNDHSFPSLSHQAIGTHVGTDYGVHTITQPADHGTAGTLTHAFTEPSDHTISVHDTVLSLPNYYALAFIQRIA